MQPLVALFFNNFLAGNCWDFVGIFPGTKAPHFPSRTVSQAHNDRPYDGNAVGDDDHIVPQKASP